MKKSLLLILFFIYNFSNAQIKFEKGYFILNDGSKIECFIKNLDWESNPSDFTYKMQISDMDFKTETIDNVEEFGIDNITTFKRAKVKMDRTSDDFQYLSKTGKPVWEENTLFLRILVQGNATLYSFRDKNLIRYFYSTQSVPLEQLVYIRYLEMKDGDPTGIVKNNNYFKQQLSNNVKADNTTNSDIENLEYKKNDLTKYFIKYNNIDTKTANEKLPKTSKGQFFLKITPGISLASLTINDGDSPSIDTKMDNKTIFKIGLETEYVLPFFKNKWSIFLNPTYQKYENSKEYSRPGLFPTSPKIVRNVDITYSSIQLPIGIRYYLLLNKDSKIFVNAAYSFDISGKATISFDKNVKLESKTASNFAFGLGYNFKNKFSAEIRLNAKKQLLPDYESFSTDYGAIDFVFGYTLF